MLSSISVEAYRQHAPGLSAVYAIGRLPNETTPNANPFAQTVRCTLPSHRQLPCLDVFAADAGRIACALDEASDRAVYLIGNAAHPSLSGDALLHWCGRSAAGDPSALRQLVGCYILLIDDRAGRRISVVSDLLGLRAWFVGTYGGRFVGGTDALGICEAGLTAGRVDYDALSSWLCYNFVAGRGSVVDDYRRTRHGAVTTFDHAGGQLTEFAYAPLCYGTETLPQEELATASFERLARSFDWAMRGKQEVNLPLSGGYDSRLLCALAAERRPRRLHVSTVESTATEVAAAREVARVLELPWQLIPRGPSLGDYYEDPLWFRPEGFPTARNLTNAVARLHPGVPVLSGFVGDTLMRGAATESTRAFFARDDTDQDDDELALAAHTRYRFGANRRDLLRPGVDANAQERARACLLGIVREGRAAGKALAYTNLRLRQCNFFSGVFLSHLNVAESLLPYCSWELLEFHARHVRSFRLDTFEYLFRRHFPRIAHIPRNTQVTSARPIRPVGPTRHLVAWAQQLLRGMIADWSSTGMVPLKVLRRVPEALLTGGRYEMELTFLYKVHAFEKRLRQAGVRIDWTKV